MVSFAKIPSVLDIDYNREFNSTVNDVLNPPYISSRLASLRKLDYCQSCNYSHCMVFGSVYKARLGKDLVNADDSFSAYDHHHYDALCVSPENFEDSNGMVVIDRMQQNDGWCNMKTLDIY